MRFAYVSDQHGLYWLVIDTQKSNEIIAVHMSAKSAAMDADRLEGRSRAPEVRRAAS